MIDYMGCRWKIIWFYLKWNVKHNWGLNKPFFPFIVLFRQLFQPKKYQTWWEIEISRMTGIPNERVLKMTSFRKGI
jgi:hypothetical protein